MMADNNLDILFPDDVLLGLRLFDAQDYFDAHEALEAAWRAERGSIRHLYQGILLIAVAYYHIQRGNYPGAVKVFQRGKRRLEGFSGEIGGLDITRFKQDYEQVEARLIQLGPKQIGLLEPSQLRPIPRTGGGRGIPIRKPGSPPLKTSGG